MLLSHDPLLHDFKIPVKQRLSKALSPGTTLPDQCGGGQIEILRAKFAITQKRALQIIFTELASDFTIERFSELFEIGSIQCQPGCHGMTTESFDQVRLFRSDVLQGIFDVKASYGPAGSLQIGLHAAAICENDHRTVYSVLDTGGQYADDALVPVFVVKAQAERQLMALLVKTLKVENSLILHLLFNGPAITVEFIQTSRQVPGMRDVFAEQTLNSHGHVLETSGGIEPWSDRIGQICCHKVLFIATCNLK